MDAPEPEGLELAKAARRARLVRRLTPAVLIGAGLFLVPWTLWLTMTLPARHQAQHWAIAWAGFDVALTAAITATGVGAWRRSCWIERPALIAATLLLCDAWFDVLTSKAGGEQTEAFFEAFSGELPLAAVCFWVAFNCELFFRRTDRIRTSIRRPQFHRPRRERFSSPGAARAAREA